MEPYSQRAYMRGLKAPFCPGCGLFSVGDSFLKAVHQLGHSDLTGFCFASGIGCSSWIPSPYFLADSVHTLHGRSIPVATSIKVVRPDLEVVVFGGDGDIVGIGLSHFVHAARRNTDIMVVMGNNMVYGMTGGQVAPTTPLGTPTSTTPFGSFEHPLDAANLAVSAGASYSARWTTAHLRELQDSMATALQLKGFRFVEVVSQCPVGFGRRAGFKDVGAMLAYFREKSVPVKEAEAMDEESRARRIVVGEFVRRSRPTLVESIQRMTEGARGRAKN